MGVFTHLMRQSRRKKAILRCLIFQKLSLIYFKLLHTLTQNSKMRTYDHGFESSRGKVRRKKKGSNLETIQRYIASLSEEQVSRMMEGSGKSYANGQDVTGRAIFENTKRHEREEVQAKLAISQPQDQSEKQADKVAVGVTKGDASISKMALEQTPSDINAKSEDAGMTTTPGFDQQLQGTKGQGSKLDANVRTEMEGHLGTDLSGVNIHTGGEAQKMSGDINAKAFAHGQDVYFNEGQYNPSSQEGKGLLAHELTHTVQQKGDVGRKVQRQDHKEEKKTLHSNILRGPGMEQLTYTLNKGPQKGDVIGEGATGPYVILIQKALNFIYKNTKGFIPLKLEKDFGPRTKAAVSRFQKDNHLLAGANGVVGPETIEHLDNAVALKEETESFQTSMELIDVYEQLQGGRKINSMTPFSSLTKGDKSPKDEGGFGVDFEGAGVPSFESYFYKGGSAKVTNEIALNILENMANCDHPFKPEIGQGGASWFITEGNPSIGKKAQFKPVRIDVEIFKKSERLIFRETDLVKMHNEELKAFEPLAEQKYRDYNKIPRERALTRRERAGLATYKFTRAEESMWTKIGQKVQSSKSKAGEVVLEPGSKFSKTPGKFTVISDPSLITAKGGIKGLTNQLIEQGLGQEPVLIKTAEKLAKKLKWTGKVRGAFRYAGKILFVVGVTEDIYKVYKAKDKVKTVVESAGGWAGASAAATAFAELWTPMDAAGPVAWVLHGVGTLVSGAVGYWLGSNTTRVIYEVAVEPEAPKKGTESEFGGFGGGSSGGGGSGGKW
ncbi:MAG: hypothetical protein JWO09_1833 [Bacteroidetes bacterium]|nr:hypothetical protein [Bacteroidota bacterium]